MNKQQQLMYWVGITPQKHLPKLRFGLKRLLIGFPEIREPDAYKREGK